MNGIIFHLGGDQDVTDFYRMNMLMQELAVSITVFDHQQVKYDGTEELDVSVVLFVEPAAGKPLPHYELLSLIHALERGQVLAIHANSPEAVDAAREEIIALGGNIH